ncbi:M13 family metallopeptidase [Corynebacterium sp. 335C]
MNDARNPAHDDSARPAAAQPAPSPAEDLYRHVNGEWIDSHEIPSDRPMDGAFHALRDRAEEDVRDLIADIAEEDPGSRIGRLYASFMDEAAVEAAGVDALAPDLADVAAAEDRDALALALGRLDRTGVTGPAGFFVEKGPDGPDAVLYLLQSGLGLPNEAYYREEGHAETLAAYREHVADMFAVFEDATVAANDFAGSDIADAFDLGDVADAARRVVDLETRIAAGHWDVVASRDALKTTNPTAVADLPSGFPWARWFAEMGVEAEAAGRINVNQPSYLEHWAQLWNDADLEDLRLWALWRVLHARAGLLPDAFVQSDFEFYGRTLTGVESLRDRWKRGVAFVEGAVGMDVGRRYVERHFPPEHKARMEELVDYLIRAYRERIGALGWMTEETRERALEKLGMFTPKIGYPDEWRDYSALEVGDDLLANARATAAFNHDHEVGKLGAPADAGEWHMTPQTVNAYYNPVFNDICFPAAILQPPFFDPDGGAAANFGAIGAVIGHEIGHGFDDQGSQYDGHGDLRQWWTDEDRAAFEGLTAKLVDQYEGLVPSVLREAGRTDAGVNGRFTLGENIGDLGGLGITVAAYRLWLADHGEEDVPEAYRDLFLSWATAWRLAIRPEAAAQLLAVDPHSPAEFRCNETASNIDEFHAAFGVEPGDGMWRDPADRVAIW